MAKLNSRKSRAASERRDIELGKEKPCKELEREGNTSVMPGK